MTSELNKRIFDWYRYEPDYQNGRYERNYKDGRYEVDGRPCVMFNLLKPDFNGLRTAGYEPLMHRLVEDEDDAAGKGDNYWMDAYGRRIALQYEP